MLKTDNFSNKQKGLFAEYKSVRIAAIAVFAVAAVAAAVGAALLPEKIFIELFSESSRPETNKLLFLVISTLVVGVAAAMCLFTENAKKWLATEAVVAILELIAVVLNIIVM